MSEVDPSAVTIYYWQCPVCGRTLAAVANRALVETNARQHMRRHHLLPEHKEVKVMRKVVDLTV